MVRAGQESWTSRRLIAILTDTKAPLIDVPMIIKARGTKVTLIIVPTDTKAPFIDVPANIKARDTKTTLIDIQTYTKGTLADVSTDTKEAFIDIQLLGRDKQGNCYWFQLDAEDNLRLWREDRNEESSTKPGRPESGPG